jgi:preprotein translocase subunit Sss1
MIRWLVLLISISTIFCVGSSFAVDNSKSVFTDESYDGEAKDVNLIWTDTQQKDAVVNVVKWWVNWVLGILSLIALIIIMYGWFLMVTSAGDDDAYSKGFTILKYAAIGLMLIGVAWFIVSIIFWLINQTASDPWPAWTES